MPVTDSDSQEYWEGAKRRELVIKQCQDCRYYIHLPRPQCPRCYSFNVKGVWVSGRGVVQTFCIVHHILEPGIYPPYVCAIVELEEQSGLHLLTNIVNCPPEQVSIAMLVEATFEEIAEGVMLPQFQPRQSQEARSGRP
ncbi:MAG: OB-fold domain-containing protein [Chloroflexi bacterium]|nr:OB-fold domain-containing protein [Chloroflexota bacterium]